MRTDVVFAFFILPSLKFFRYRILKMCLFTAFGAIKKRHKYKD